MQFNPGRANVWFTLYRSKGYLSGQDVTMNDMRIVCKAVAGRYTSIAAVEKSYQQLGVMRGQAGVIDYQATDLDSIARSGDRLQVTGALYPNTPEGMMTGRWFVVDNGEAYGWGVRAGLNEVAGSIETGGETSPGGVKDTGTLTEADLIFRQMHESYAEAITGTASGTPTTIDQYSLDDAGYGGLAATHYKVRTVSVFMATASDATTTIYVTISGIGGLADKTYTVTLTAGDTYQVTTVNETLDITENAAVTVEGYTAAAVTTIPTGVTVRLSTEYVPN